tara:strand:+ start:27014 stop:27379 length:366 start_codon:yes stop_codon:yes gene_type:complete
MATISKLCLSESTDGRGISVADNSGTITTIHTGTSVAADYHEIWLWASSHSVVTETLTLQWGGTTEAGDHFITTINPNETVLIAPGWLLKGNSSALIVKAYTTTNNQVNITGYVNLIDAAS